MKQIQLLLRNTYKISMDVVHFTSTMIMKARRETQTSIFPACMFSMTARKFSEVSAHPLFHGWIINDDPESYQNIYKGNIWGSDLPV